MVSDQLIASHGALKRVWIASCWERKISKSQFLQTNLQKTIDAITTDDHEPLTLRMSGQLLLGVVRIYSRKTRYLLEDCNGALEKIKQAFKKGDVNMPDIRHAQVKMKSITLPDRLTEFDVLLPDDPLLDFVDGKDPILDSLSQMASSQDITLSDMSFGWDVHNPTMDSAMRNELDEAEHGRVDVGDLEDTSVEQGRRDTEMLHEQADTSIGDIENPLTKGHYDDGNMLDFDDFDFGGDDFGDIDPAPAANEEAFQAPLSTQLSEMDSSLMQSGLIRDDEDMSMFDAPEMNDEETPRRRRRKLAVDRETEIPHDQLRQLANDPSATINRNANSRQHVAPKKSIQWNRPMKSTPGTALDSFFSRLTHPRPAPLATLSSPAHVDLELPLEAAAHELPRPGNAQDDFGGMDFDFDDDLDFGGPAGLDGENAADPEAAGAADTAVMTQSSQMGQKASETLELVKDRAQQGDVIRFGDLGASTKAEAARRFYDILLLTTKDMLKVQQDKPFAEIQIRV